MIPAHLPDAYYFSCPGADLCFDPFSKEYLYFTTELRRLHPPVTGEMFLYDMPGYQGPRFHDFELQRKTKSSCVSSHFSGSAYLCLHSFKYAAGHVELHRRFR